MKTPIKTHGGKHYLSKWIISHFPADYVSMDYIEVFGGGASVMLQKKRSKSEQLNDLDRNTFNFWRIVKGDGFNLAKHCYEIQCSKDTFDRFLLYSPWTVFQEATKEFVLRRMSRGGAKKSFSKSKRTRRGMPEHQSAWLNGVDLIMPAFNRLQDVSITNLDFRKIFDVATEETLLYLDPPYLHETRVSKKMYECEMTREDHEDLLRRCNDSNAKIVLSGYRSSLYDEQLNNWNRVEKSVANHSSQEITKKRKTECLWMNY